MFSFSITKISRASAPGNSGKKHFTVCRCPHYAVFFDGEPALKIFCRTGRFALTTPSDGGIVPPSGIQVVGELAGGRANPNASHRTQIDRREGRRRSRRPGERGTTIERGSIANDPVLNILVSHRLGERRRPWTC